jgi:transposase-like protein
MTKHSPFHYFKTRPEVIRLAVMMYVRFPLSLRNVEDLLRECEINLAGQRWSGGAVEQFPCNFRNATAL